MSIITMKNCLPAESGWYVMIEEIKDNKVIGFAREPVIAWLIFGSQNEINISPITVWGLQENQILQRPDGSFTRPGDADFEDISSVLEDANYWLQQTLRKEARDEAINQGKVIDFDGLQ